MRSRLHIGRLVSQSGKFLLKTLSRDIETYLGLCNQTTALDLGFGSPTTVLNCWFDSQTTALNFRFGRRITEFDVGFGSQTAVLNFGLGSRTTVFIFGLGSPSKVLSFGFGSRTTLLILRLGSRTTEFNSGLQYLAFDRPTDRLTDRPTEGQTRPPSYIFSAETKIGTSVFWRWLIIVDIFC